MSGRQAGAKSQIKQNLLYLATITADLALIGLSILVIVHPIYLPVNPAANRFQSFLPALASLTGSLIAILNALTISSLVTAYAKKLVVGQGVELSTLKQLFQLSTAQIPVSRPSD